MRTFFRTFLCVPLSIIPVLTAAQNLHAQDDQPVIQEGTIDTPYRWIERGIRVGLYGGYVFTNRGQLNLGPGSTPIVGARARFRVSSPLTLEINLGYGFDSNLFLTDPRSPKYPAPIDTVGVTWGIVQGIIQFSLTGARTWHGIQPYFLLGGGVYFGLSQQPTDQIVIPTRDFLFRIGTQPVADFGIGVERHFGQTVGVALEIRDHLWRIAAPDGFFRPDILLELGEDNLPVAESSDWTMNFEFSLAGYYYF